MATIKTVLFDLDGTLLDTAPDLAYALNQTLQHYGQAALPFEKIRPTVSHGGMALIKLGFDLTPGDDGFEARHSYLLEVYKDNIARETTLFPGMETVLAWLEDSQMPWGVVTNKPAWLTDPLLKSLDLFDRAASVISGDTLPQRKPDPAPILLACKQANTSPESCLYIGDAARDIEAGKRAGTFTGAALFGYLVNDEDPEHWGADYHFETPGTLLTFLRMA